MTILNDILTECSYTAAEPFRFTYSRTREMKNCEAAAYLSQLDRNQVYLLVCVDPLELPELLSGNFMANLAKTFRKQPYHESPMDRNTSLLLICRYSAEAVPDHDAKVRLEDDPYYFKKYVFSFTAEQETASLNYLEGQKASCGDDISLCRAIQNCLLDPAMFNCYKQDTTTEPAYAFFAELSAKLVILPVQPRSSGNIRSVQERWDAGITDIPGEDVKAMELITRRILETKKNVKQPEWNLDEILSIWNNRGKRRES